MTISLFPLIVLSACNIVSSNSTSPVQSGSSEEIRQKTHLSRIKTVSDNTDVTLRINGDPEDGFFDVVILNRSNMIVLTGNPWAYLLEKEENSLWYEVETEKGAYTDEAYTCPENTPLTQRVDLISKYGYLPAGHYRIAKQLLIGGEAEWYIAEFTIAGLTSAINGD